MPEAPRAQALRHSAAAWLRRRDPRLWVYGLPSSVALLASQTWLRPGKVFATGDIPPPLVPGNEYLSHWNQYGRGEGTPAYDIVGLPYYEGLRLATWLGLGDEIFQRIWLGTLYAASAAAVAFFVLSLTRRASAAAAAGLLATLSAYHFVTAGDSIPLLAIALAGFLGGLVVRAGLRHPARIPHALSFAVISLGLGFVFLNPPHIALVFMWLLISAACVVVKAGRSSVLPLLRFLGAALPLAVLINVWWLVPTLLTLFGSGSGERFPLIDVDAWAWTHRRASLTNAFALNTYWGWSFPEYFPYAHRLDRFPFDVLRFCFPALALLGLVLSRGRERRVPIVLGVASVALIWAAKGLHPPLGEVNHFLYDHVPAYWLFRDPVKMLLLLTLCYAVLGGLGVMRLLEGSVGGRAVGASIAAGLLLGTLAYSHPLFTGEAVSNDPATSRTRHVNVPRQWQQAADLVNRDPAQGKVLILPTLSFYQAPTIWGYWGVSFSPTLFHRGIFEKRIETGWYLRSPGSVVPTVAEIERDLLERNPVPMRAKLRALGIRYVIVRRDLDRTISGLPFADDEALIRALQSGGVARIGDFGIVQVFRLGGRIGSEVYAARPVEYRGPTRWIPRALEVDRESALVTAPLADGAPFSTGTLRVFRSQRGLWRLAVRSSRGRLLVRLSDPLRDRPAARRGGAPPLAPKATGFDRVRPPFVITVGSRAISVSRSWTRWHELGLVSLENETAIGLWRISPRRERLPVDARGRLQDCRRPPQETRTVRELGLSAEVLERGVVPALRLAARQDSACVTYPIPAARPGIPLQISFDHRHIRGSRPRACLWQYGLERCARFPALSRSRKWSHVAGTVVAAPGTTALRLFLYADVLDEGQTVADYRRLEVRGYDLIQERQLRVPALARVGDVPRDEESLRTVLRPYAQEASLDLDAASPVEDCNRYDSRTAAQVGLSATVVDRGASSALRLSALDHSACVFFPIEPFQPDTAYRLSLSYRFVRGQPGRVCVWQDGPEHCAPMPGLRRSRNWRRMSATIKPEPWTTAMRVFLYADGAGGANPTVTEYKDLRMDAISTAVVLGARSGVLLPRVAYERVSPSEFRARVTGATEPFLLVLTEALAPGWRLEVPGRDSSDARHVRVNGYANGWVIPWSGSFEVKMTYRPERIARLGRRLGGVLILLILGVAIAWFALSATGRGRRPETVT